MKLFSPETRRDLLRGWLLHARKGWKKHERAAMAHEVTYRRLGVTGLVFSAVVGASLFAALEAAFEPWGRLLAGLVSLTAAVVTGLLTFHRYEERAEKHRAAGVGYKAALRRIEEVLSREADGGDLEVLQAEIDRLRADLDQLEAICPVVPAAVDRAVEGEYRTYAFVPTVEELRPTVGAG